MYINLNIYRVKRTPQYITGNWRKNSLFSGCYSYPENLTAISFKWTTVEFSRLEERCNFAPWKLHLRHYLSGYDNRVFSRETWSLRDWFSIYRLRRNKTQNTSEHAHKHAKTNTTNSKMISTYIRNAHQTKSKIRVMKIKISRHYWIFTRKKIYILRFTN